MDATDIDLVFANFGSANPAFDVDNDGDTDERDIDEFVLNVIGTRFGDIDLDHDVDINDFHRATMNYDPLGKNLFNGWAEGNFDGDRDVDISDILRVAKNQTPLGYPPFSALMAVRTPVTVTELPAIDSATAAALRGARQQLKSQDLSPEKELREKRNSVRRDHRLDLVIHTAEELYEDTFFDFDN